MAGPLRDPASEGTQHDVALAGGHGKIALRLTRLLRDRGDSVRSLIRNPDHSDDVRGAGAEPVVCDLEHAGEAEVAEAVGSVDAFVFAAAPDPAVAPSARRPWTTAGRSS